MFADETTANELIGKEMADALRNLYPDLLVDLALLDGQTIDELTSTLQKTTSYSDYAVLVDDGYIARSSQGYVATPKLAALAHAAHVLRDHLSMVTGSHMAEFLGQDATS